MLIYCNNIRTGISIQELYNITKKIENIRLSYRSNYYVLIFRENNNTYTIYNIENNIIVNIDNINNEEIIANFILLEKNLNKII